MRKHFCRHVHSSLISMGVTPFSRWIKSHGAVIPGKDDHSKQIFFSLFFYWHFVCSIYQTFSGVSSTVNFSIHALLDSHLYSVSNTLNPFLSFSVSPSLALSPLDFYLGLILMKSDVLNHDRHWKNWFQQINVFLISGVHTTTLS